MQNHVHSRYCILPKTSINSVNLQDYPQSPQAYIKNYPFLYQNRNKQQTSFYTKYLSSDDDDYHQPDIFSPYTQEYCTQRPRQS